MSWNHTVGSGADRIAIVSVSTSQTASGTAVAHGSSSSATTGTGTNTFLEWTHTVGSGSNRLAVVSVAEYRNDIVFVGSASGSNTGAGVANSRTWSHTVTADANRILIVGVAINRNTGANNQTVESVTWNGTGLTRIGEAPYTTKCTAELWYLKNPASGTFNIIVTLADSATARFVAGAMNFANVDQTTPLGAFGAAYGTSRAPAVGVTTGLQDLVVDVVAQTDQTYLSDEDWGQTRRWNGDGLPYVTSNGSPMSNDIRMYGSTKPASPFGNTGMSWWIDNDTAWSHAAVALKPASTVNGITQVTYAGTDITANLIGFTRNINNCGVYMYYMVNPPVATNTVRVTQSLATRFVAASSSFTNVDQAAPIGTFEGDYGISGTASV